MYKRITLAVLAVVLVTGVLIINTSLRAAAKDWEKLKGLRLSSVVWSPDGKSIAFVAVSNDGEDYVEDEGATPGRASLWTAPVDTKPRTPKCVHTIKADGGWGHGIPVGLFWATPGKLGWATDYCTLYTINLKDHKTAQLQKLSIMLQQSRSHPEWTGPDDVYYDPSTRTIIFTGTCSEFTEKSSETSQNLLCAYSTENGSLEIHALPGSMELMTTASCHIPPDIAYPEYYIAGAGRRNGKYCMTVWSDSVRSRGLVELASTDGQILFPRPSPDNEKLAWLERGAEDSKWSLVLFDIKSKAKKVIALLPDQLSWSDVRPSLGCPFAWSPDGTRIAYTSGQRIELVTIK